MFLRMFFNTVVFQLFAIAVCSCVITIVFFNLFFQDQTVQQQLFFISHCEWFPGLSIRVLFQLFFRISQCIVVVFHFSLRIVFRIEHEICVSRVFQYSCFFKLFVQYFFFSTVVFRLFAIAVFACFITDCFQFGLQDQTVHCSCLSLFIANSFQD